MLCSPTTLLAAALTLSLLLPGPLRADDWPQWRGPNRDGVCAQTGLLQSFPAEGLRLVWRVPVGWGFSSPVVAQGRVYLADSEAVKPKAKERLHSFDEATGKFLWQHSSEKLPAGFVHDWPNLGICSTPYVEGKRLWYVTNRDEITCLDTEGFLDGKNDGPFKEEPNEEKNEADIIWKIDMMGKFGASPHNACSCSVTALGDVLFVSTSNGVDEAHKVIAQPNAPSFLALDKNTGAVLWSDKSPGSNIMHGQWSSPACGKLGGVDQVIFAGGDGWLYGFDVKGDAVSLDARPSDAIALALRLDCPIYVEQKVIDLSAASNQTDDSSTSDSETPPDDWPELIG